MGGLCVRLRHRRAARPSIPLSHGPSDALAQPAPCAGSWRGELAPAAPRNDSDVRCVLSCPAAASTAVRRPVEAAARRTPPRRTSTRLARRPCESPADRRRIGLVQFRSIPFSAPPTALFPPSSVPQFTTQNKFFSLRCFPSQPRHPAESTRSTSAPPKPPPAASPKKSLPTPPPSLDPSTLFLDAPPPARQALLARLARARKPYTLDLTILAGKKKVHKSAVVRERCRRRVRECVRAVVVRNADREEGGEGLRVGEGEVREVGPRKWLLPGRHLVLFGGPRRGELN